MEIMAKPRCAVPPPLLQVLTTVPPVSRQVCGGQGRRLGVVPQPLRDAAEAKRHAERRRQGEALQRGAGGSPGGTERRCVVFKIAHPALSAESTVLSACASCMDDSLKC